MWRNIEMKSMLMESFLHTQTAPDVDKFERAKVIRKEINDNQISIREFAEMYNIPKSTIDDWLLYEKISAEDYKKLKSEGYSAKNIYRLLRNNRKENIKELSGFDLSVKNFLNLLKDSQNIHNRSHRTNDLVQELENECRRFRFKIEKEEKRVNRNE